MPRRRTITVQSTAEVFDDLRADYSATKASRFRRRRTGIASGGAGADYHYRSEAEYLKLGELARDFDRNDVIVGQIVCRAVNNTVQGGMQLNPNTGDKSIDHDIKQRWATECCDPDGFDVSGEHDFNSLEELSLREMFVVGDICAVLPAWPETKLEMIEAHRLRTPKNTKKNVVHGVLLDQQRRRQEYWFTKDDLDPMRALHKVADITSVPARDDDGNRRVAHVYNPKRVSQTRGVTAFAPIFDTAGMFEDLNFAKLVQAQVVSCFSLIRNRGEQFEFPPGDGSQTGPRTSQVQRDGTTRTLEGVGPGIELIAARGETITGFSPNVPNAEFFEHVRLLLSLIGVNLGMPLVLVLMDASETNFSGWRGAIDQARLGFKRNQRALIRRFHRPIYGWKVRLWMLDDTVLRHAHERSDVDVLRHSWNPPNWPYIQPLQDAAADTMIIRNGLNSPRRVHAKNGREWDEISTEIVDDNGEAIVKAKTRAKEINDKFPEDPVTWRDLLSLPMAEGINLSISADGGNEGGGNRRAQPTGAGDGK